MKKNIMTSKDKSSNLEVSNQELFEIISDIARKINDIHRLHFWNTNLKSAKIKDKSFLQRFWQTLQEIPMVARLLQ